MLRPTLFSIFLLTVTACGSDRNKPIEDRFGAEFAATDVVPAESLVSTYPNEALVDSVRTTLRGTVHKVCQAKGCWMTVDAGDGEDMTVTFRDYGFFVPKDIDGREVIMHGVAYTQLTPVDELRHLAEDAGQSEADIAAITEARRELRFLADGVALISQ